MSKRKMTKLVFFCSDKIFFNLVLNLATLHTSHHLIDFLYFVVFEILMCCKLCMYMMLNLK